MASPDRIAWVTEAEKAAIDAAVQVNAAYAAYLEARQRLDRLAAVAANRRAVRDARSYTLFPGAGTEIT